MAEFIQVALQRISVRDVILTKLQDFKHVKISQSLYFG